MLKKLEIKDFEAHKNTTLNFGPGLNVIHGKSNNGKSASLRAIELAAYGVWAAGENKKAGVNGPVRVGAKSCEITVESDRGSVTVRRGKNINEWDISNTTTGEELSLQNPGAGSIPQAQDVLGLKSVEIAGAQIRFNWSDQRDKHFLIDEVEGKSSSPSFVAGVLDEVGGLSGCEDLVRDLAADKGAFEKAMKDSAEKTQKLDEELEKFTGLDDEIAHFSATEEKLNRAEELQKQADLLKNLSKRIKDIKNDLVAYENLEKEIAKIKKAEKILSESYEKFENQQRARKISAFYGSISTKIKEIDTVIEKLDLMDLPSTIEKRENSERAQKESEETRKLLTKIQKLQFQIDEFPEIVNFGKTIRTLAQTESRILSLEASIKLKKSIDDKERTVADTHKKYESSKKEHNSAKAKYETIINELDICPMCNQKITAECKAEMIEGV